MKKVVFVLLTICLFSISKIIAQQIFASSGDFFKDTHGSISFTIGEPINETFSKFENILTQGYQQSKLPGLAINELTESLFKVSIFPNPCKDFIIINVDNIKDYDIQLELYGIIGNLLIRDSFDCAQKKILLTGLQSSFYYLKVIINKKEVRSFKIVKQ
jgi:hypothetical protein